MNGLPGLVDTEEVKRVATRLAEASGLVIFEMYSPECSSLVDRMAMVKEFGAALYEWLTLDVVAAERAVRAGQMLPAMPVMPDPAEMLAKAVAQRDKIRDQIEHAEEQMRQLDGTAMETAKIPLEMSVIQPLSNELERCEEYISHIQKRMEEAAQL